MQIQIPKQGDLVQFLHPENRRFTVGPILDVLLYDTDNDVFEVVISNKYKTSFAVRKVTDSYTTWRDVKLTQDELQPEQTQPDTSLTSIGSDTSIEPEVRNG